MLSKSAVLALAVLLDGTLIGVSYTVVSHLHTGVLVLRCTAFLSISAVELEAYQERQICPI